MAGKIVITKGRAVCVTEDDLKFTIEICRKSLPGTAHYAHLERLDVLERLVEWEFAKEGD